MLEDIELCIPDKSTYDVVYAIISHHPCAWLFSVKHTSITNATHNVIVSPGNSFGEMNGGVDGIVNTHLSSYTPCKYIQDDVKDIIRTKHYGELHVGQSIFIRTSHPKHTGLIYAPTMRVPEDVSRTVNAYTAFRSVLMNMMNHDITCVSTPLFCTGAGCMNVRDAIHQMLIAVETVVTDQLTSIHADWKMYHDHHRRLLPI